MSQPVVTVFGSSRPLAGDPEYVLARDLGRALGKSGFTLCNGGYAGTMEASARGAKEHGARTIGVITDVFKGREANPWIEHTIPVGGFIERLLKLVELGDAYVVLKGGTGTLLELAAVWELMNQGMMGEKPILVLGEFWRGVVTTLNEELAWEGLGECTRYVSVLPTAAACADHLTVYFSKR